MTCTIRRGRSSAASICESGFNAARYPLCAKLRLRLDTGDSSPWVVQHISVRVAVHELKGQTAILTEILELLRSRTP
jgi:hypothetical protein